MTGRKEKTAEDGERWGEIRKKLKGSDGKGGREKERVGEKGEGWESRQCGER